MARLARTGQRAAGLKGDATIPRIEAYATVAPDRQRLRAFNDLVCASPSDFVPLTWPYAVATPLHLYLVSAPEFPLPALGLVHLREVIVQTRPIPADAELSFRARVEGHRPHRRGVEFDLVTEVSLGASAPIVWQSTTTALWRSEGGRRRAPELAPANPPSGERWRIPEETGRRYACVSRNFDPIHLHTLTSRWFGFRRPIVHGMWTVARAVAALGAFATAPPLRLDVRFRSPLFLPGEAVFSARGDDERRVFAVYPAWGGRAHLEGELRRL
ncbi:MAG: hypothetical protein H6710_24575 [Myxococcales bacterium]|nr:hypothetical protein [Myxococcales bacterium]MCB9703890.1 hypothetical protein [Myxococcales bacterium]